VKVRVRELFFFFFAIGMVSQLLTSSSSSTTTTTTTATTTTTITTISPTTASFSPGSSRIHWGLGFVFCYSTRFYHFLARYGFSHVLSCSP